MFKKLIFSLVLLLLFSTQTSFAGNIDEVRDYLSLYYVDEVSDSVLNQETIDEILAQLDEHTIYMNEAEFEQFINSLDPSFAGIGVTVESTEAGVLVITTFPHAPAGKAGIEAGDIIIEADGENLVGQPLELATSHIRGEAGTTVHLKVYRPQSDETLTFEVTREKIEVPTVDYTTLSGDIGYLQLRSFGENSANKIEEVLSNHVHDGWIFDLRYNGGGYLETAREVLGFFPDVEHALQVEQNNEIHILDPISQRESFQQPVHFLINPFSASASEIVAGAIQDYDIGTLYGQTTYGKGSIQNMIPLSEGGTLKLTTARYLTPKGFQVDGVGITPDVETEIGEELHRAHGDLLLQDLVYYTSLGELNDVPVDKTFTVRATADMDWTTGGDAPVKLMQVGGGEVEVEFEPVSETEMKLIPTSKLDAGSQYILVVHPQWKSAAGVQIERGYFIKVSVEDENKE
ncbi:S41 family peptidase [Anaerobacillus sp. MEB173]|uniref:S41 family peptidase n=1 Tax=Anaerobacillus sp. MEB173 TaxID=3383345 RepID=UPI003F91E5C2